MHITEQGLGDTTRTVLLPAILAASLIAVLAGCATSGGNDEPAIEDIDISTVAEGTYRGEQAGFPVSAEVEVTVVNGRVTTIDVLKHQHGPGHGAEAITEKVIARQSLMVDAITGSTKSSRVMVKAIETAIKKGL